jgi:ABC-type sugar transport system permease subunit
MKNYLTARSFPLAWIILAPFLAYFAVFGLYPVAFSLYLGTVHWVGLQDAPVFNGWDNFVAFFQDSTYTDALASSLFLGGLIMVVSVVVGLVGAYVINLGIRGTKVHRVIWYLPAVLPAIAVTQVFALFLNPSGGVFNAILAQFGMEPQAWSTSYFWMVFWIVVYASWKGIGATMILWLAGLQAINREIYEQASIDGANRVTTFFRITLPLLSSIGVYVVITGFVGAIQVFDPVMFISRTAPFGQTHVLVTRVFQDFYGNLNFGMAGASALVMTAVVGIFTLLTLRYYKKQGGSHA